MADADTAADACPAVFASRHPTEQELIASYLHPRLLLTTTKPATAVVPRFIHHADAYAADPADLTARHLPARAADGARAWYFFSPVRTTTERGTRRARAVESGEGCWHSESGVRAVVDAAGRRVGHRQFFSFVKKREEDGKRVRTGWLMVELGLDNDASNPASSDELVLCKIYMTPRMPPSSPPSAVTSSATMELMPLPRMPPSSPPSAVTLSAATMELMPGGHKRKISDEISPAATSPPQQKRRQRYVAEGTDNETTDGSKESSGESSVVILDDDDEAQEDGGGSRLKESSNDCVMLPHSRENEQDGANDEPATRTSNGVTGRHGELLPDLNVATTVEEEGRHARVDATRRQDGGTSGGGGSNGSVPQAEVSTTMAAGERGSTTGHLAPAAGYRRTLMLFLEEEEEDDAMEDEHQQPPPATTATRTAEANLQLQRQPPCCTFVVHPCAAHAKMRHGAAYGCGCRVTGAVRRGGYHLPRRGHTTTKTTFGQ